LYVIFPPDDGDGADEQAASETASAHRMLRFMIERPV
jgi:hypothetical protein